MTDPDGARDVVRLRRGRPDGRRAPMPGGRTVAHGLRRRRLGDAITPPGRPAHALTYTKQGVISTYTAPGAAAMTLGYDADDTLTSIDRPGAGDATLDLRQRRAAAARWSTPGAARPSATTTRDRPAGASGSRRRARRSRTPSTVRCCVNDTFTGDAAGTIARTYDDELRVESSAVGDADRPTTTTTPTGCPIQAGELVTTRSPNGLRTGTLICVRSRAPRPTTRTASRRRPRPRARPGSLWAWSIERDAPRGSRPRRPAGSRRRTAATTAGRLTRATRNGADVTYTYDANGNLLARTEARRPSPASTTSRTGCAVGHDDLRLPGLGRAGAQGRRRRRGRRPTTTTRAATCARPCCRAARDDVHRPTASTGARRCARTAP